MENPAEVYASCPSGYKVFLRDPGQITGDGTSRGVSIYNLMMTIVSVKIIYTTR